MYNNQKLGYFFTHIIFKIIKKALHGIILNLKI